MADQTKDPKNLMHYLLTTHAPLINQTIQSLKGTGKLPKNMEDWEFHEPGMRGLMEAVLDYKPEVAQRIMPDSKNPFATFARTRIMGRIQDHADSMHHVPKHIRQQAKRFEAYSEPQAPVNVTKPEPEKP